jgi:hypothetical protein
MQKEKSCGFCKHFHPDGDHSASGECKYNPPVAYNPTEDVHGFSIAKGVWPTTYLVDWCSKFEEE